MASSSTPGHYVLYESAFSGNCFKVRLLLTQLGLPFHSEQVSVHGDRKAQRTGTPVGNHLSGTIPLLVLPDGSPLAESNALLMFLATGTRYYSDEPVVRHRIHEWLFWEQNQLEPFLGTLRYARHVAPGTKLPEAYEQLLLARSHEALRTANRHLTSSRWFGSPDYSIGDIAVYGYAHLAHQAGIDLAKEYPALAEWAERVSRQPGHQPMAEPARD